MEIKNCSSDLKHSLKGSDVGMFPSPQYYWEFGMESNERKLGHGWYLPYLVCLWFLAVKS